jgi:hypothetical protein
MALGPAPDAAFGLVARHRFMNGAVDYVPLGQDFTGTPPGPGDPLNPWEAVKRIIRNTFTMAAHLISNLV